MMEALKRIYKVFHYSEEEMIYLDMFVILDSHTQQ